MIPNQDFEYPACLAELSLAQKKIKAEEIYREFVSGIWHAPEDLMRMCQGDFRLSSLVAYHLAVEYYRDKVSFSPNCDFFNTVDPLFMPVRYSGGNMVFGRVFVINHCAFSSADSVIGFRNAEVTEPDPYFRVLKGLNFVGCYKNWVLFKLDRSSTDDMTGMLYTPLEKNFTVEFAHFPHDSGLRHLYRWEDC